MSFKFVRLFILAISVTCIAACTDAAVDNNVDTNNIDTNNDVCNRGERRCEDDRTLATCADGTGFVTVTCQDDEVCEDADCKPIAKNCDDKCDPDETRCTMDGTVETCADHNSNGCLEFGDPVTCSDGLICDPNDGLCKPSDCTDDCAANETSCEDDLITTCFQAPDGCLAFGKGKECPDGDVCRTGACVEPPDCTDECTVGDGACTADGQVRNCINGPDNCAVFEAPADCPNTQECRNGTCQAARPCTDQCLAGERVCVTNQIAMCETNSEGCLEFTTPVDCPGAQTCSNQVGVVMCDGVNQNVPVVINEIFYDAVGDDVRGSGVDAESPTFIELFGAPGGSIGGYNIELVNGSTGTQYATFQLPADAILDGNGFAVIATDKPDSLLSILSFFTNVYYVMTFGNGNQDAMQNGADNVRLMDDSGTLLDAVGYGKHDPANYAGEGPCVSMAACNYAPDATSGRSVGRIVDGADTNNNEADFQTFYPTPGFDNSDLIINEVYFNEPGSDTGAETFVELIAPITGWEDLPLDGYVLHAINGFDGADYIFSGALPGIEMTLLDLNSADSDDGFVVICNLFAANDALLDLCTVPFDGVDFQNGPDNFVLRYEGRVIDAVGYGSFSTAMFVGEGMPKPFSGSNAGKSLARWPISDPSRDLDTDNNRDDFHVVDPTPGKNNPLPAP